MKKWANPRKWKFHARGNKSKFAPKAAGQLTHGASLASRSELELGLIHTDMAQKPVLRVEVGTCQIAQKTGTALGWIWIWKICTGGICS